MIHSLRLKRDSASHAKCFGLLDLQQKRSGCESGVGQTDLTRGINQMVLEGQLPHKNARLLISLVTANKKLTVLWGS